MRWVFCILMWAQAASAETVIALRNIRPSEVIAALDLGLVSKPVPGAAESIADVLGKEAKTMLYAGRPVYLANLTEPALVERNQIIDLRFSSSGLAIETEGRALGRGALGEIVRVMNLSSRTTVTATVSGPGLADVSR